MYNSIKSKIISLANKYRHFFQFFIALGILATAYFTFITFKKQDRMFDAQVKYFEQETRPWVAPELLPVCKITNNKIFLQFEMYNPGKTTAQKLILYGDINKSKEFPVNKIKKKLNRDEHQKIGILFPNQKLYWKPEIEMFLQGRKATREQIIKEVKEKLWYLHIYINYKSESINYFLKETLLLEYLEEKDGQDIIKWNIEYSSTEPL